MNSHFEMLNFNKKKNKKKKNVGLLKEFSEDEFPFKPIFLRDK